MGEFVGGLWCQVGEKSLCYQFAHTGGFASGMHNCAKAGSIRNAVLAVHHPMIVAQPKSSQSPYLSSVRGGSGYADTMKSILANVLKFGNFMNQTGATSAAVNAAQRLVGQNTERGPMPMQSGETRPGDRPADLQGPKRPRYGGGFF